MARDGRAQALIAGFLAAVGLVACAAAAEPDLACPDYVTRYAPLIWLHSDDPYMPSDLLTHVRRTTPMVDGEPIADVPSLNLDNLETLNEHGDGVALTSDDNPLERPEWLLGETPDEAGRLHNSTACFVILVEKSEVDVVDAFYFYFYSYDEGANITQVLEPLDRLVSGEKADTGMHFGNHVGDWEHNMVRFQERKPVGIYYSQHRDGKAYQWDDSTLTLTDERPVVYSARGSHANYATPGDQVHDKALVDYCDAGTKWDPVSSAAFYRFDPETSTLTRLAAPGSPSPPSANETSFFHFLGHWGDAQYADGDPRQETVPYLGLKRFQTGPTGPRYKHLVRAGLAPDEGRAEGWLEWGAGVFMAVYPWGVKGWRKWVLGVVVVVLAVAAVLGVRFGIRRYRGTGGAYSKLQEEEVPLDEWRREEEQLYSSSEEEEDEDDEEQHRR